MLIQDGTSLPCKLLLINHTRRRDHGQALSAVLDCCLPSNCVVVHVHLAQAAHHVQLVASTCLTLIAITASNGLQAINSTSTIELQGD